MIILIMVFLENAEKMMSVIHIKIKSVYFGVKVGVSPNSRKLWYFCTYFKNLHMRI